MVDKINKAETLTEAIDLSVQIQLSNADSTVKRPLLRLVEAKIALLKAKQQLDDAYVVPS